MNFKKYFKAQSLIEILIGLGVVAIVFSAITGLMYMSLQNSKTTRERALAQTLIDDTSSAISGIINSDWHSLYTSEGGIGYWSLDEGADIAADNKVVLDEIFGNNGLINLGTSGNTSLAQAWQSDSSCVSGKCLSFDGSDDYIDCGSDESLAFGTGNFTIGLWIKANGTSQYNAILDKGQPLDSSKSGYQLFLTNGLLRYNISDGAGHWTELVVGGSPDMRDNIWHHFVWVYNGTNNKFYLDKTLLDTDSWTYGSGNPTANFLLATSWITPFSGLIDEVRIYNRVLLEDEVKAIYESTK